MIFQYIANGLAAASGYALIAIGITLIFGLTRIVNFAQGQFLVLGGLVTWSSIQIGLPYGVAAVVATASCGALGWMTERFLFRRTLEAPILGFIVSLGLIIVLEHATLKVWGSVQRFVPPPIDLVLTVGDVRVPAMRFVVFVVTVLFLTSFYLLLLKTRWGRAVRAVASDAETAAAMGIPVSTYISGVFVVGSAMAGLAGALMITLFPMSPFSGGSYIVMGFAVAIIGGLGNIVGAAAAAFTLGLFEAGAGGYLSTEWTTAYVFIGMLVVVMFRPTGLMRGAH